MGEMELISVDEVINTIDKNNENKKFDKNNSLYWDMLSEVILENQILRKRKNITQKELADRMDTKQTSISRFENMGRAPNYDFIMRLANALGCEPKLYIDGKYSVQVPNELKDKVNEIVKKKNISTVSYLADIIERNICKDYREIQFHEFITSLEGSADYSCDDYSVESNSTESDKLDLAA